MIHTIPDDEYRDAIVWLRPRIGAGEVIGYQGVVPIYFLWNEDISNRVEYVDDQDCLELASLKIDYFFRPRTGGTCEEQLSRSFQTLYEDQSVWIGAPRNSEPSGG